VAVSSLGATRAIPITPRGSVKAALESMVAPRAELAPEGLRINAVSAGTVDTDALLHFPTRGAARGRPTSHARGPAAEPQDVANTVVFLCTEYASMIHGQVIVVDGATPSWRRDRIWDLGDSPNPQCRLVAALDEALGLAPTLRPLRAAARGAGGKQWPEVKAGEGLRALGHLLWGPGHHQLAAALAASGRGR